MNSNSKINNRSHVGVYGIIFKNSSILLIKKSRGPYCGKLDLPGGRPEHGETLEQTLAREIVEETGIAIKASKLFNNYSITVEWSTGEDLRESMHHIGMIYLITDYDDSLLIDEMNFEDSLGAQWYELKNLTKDMTSPFAYQAIVDIDKIS